MAKRLKFDDIDEWTPSSISIVDEPAHPLCKFEVYEDDEEYVKKSIEINEGEMMVENPQSEPKVEVSESFFERLLGKAVGKADEVPPAEPEEEEKPDDLEARIAKLEDRLAKIESELKKDEPQDPAPGAVAKSDGEAGEGEAESESESEGEEEAEEETSNEDEEKLIDESEAVSKSLDPDLIETGSSEKSLVERAGRNTNGMTW